MNKRKGIIILLGLATAVAVHATINEKNFETVNLLDSSRVFDIDEVVVISQPKESFVLRKQPLSSSIFGKQDLTALNVRDIRELSAYVPSFVMPNYGARLTSAMYVRGIGSRVNSPAVGIYVDGMPVMSKAAFNYHIYGLERVDVLRGPQGTLYGQNTEGGLVRIYTHNPMNYQGTDVRLGFGTRTYRTSEVAHYRKINERLAFSIAGFYDGSNGFFRNSNTGERADKYNEAGGRFRFIARPTERWTADFIADYQYTRQNGFPYGSFNPATNEMKAPSTTFQSNYRRNFVNTSLNLSHRGNGLDFSSITSYQYMKDNMKMDQDYTARDLLSLNQRQFQNAFTQELIFKGNVKNVWYSTTGAFMSLQWLKTQGPVQFGKDLTNPLSAVIRNEMYDAIVKSMVPGFIARGLSQAAAEAAAKSLVDSRGGVQLSTSMSAPGVYRTPEFNLGFFHESNVKLFNRITATVGLRYDFHQAKINYQSEAYMVNNATVMGTNATTTLSSLLDGRARTKFEQLLPKFGITYRLDSKGSNVYALVSKGYRAGGYNIQMFSDLLQTELMANRDKARRNDYAVPHTSADYERVTKTISYKPETSWNYEAGTHLNLLGNKLHFDLSAYYMAIRNQQLSVMARDLGFGRMMVNAGKSESYGLEAALRGSALSDHLSWMINYGYTHAAFKAYTDYIRSGGGTLVEVSYKGKRVPYIPEHTFSAMADYKIDLQRCFVRSLTLGANVTAQGKTYWNEANTYAQKFFAVAGAHADADLGLVQIGLWVRNLTQTRYNAFAFDSSATRSQLFFAQPGNPIQMGVDISLHF